MPFRAHVRRATVIGAVTRLNVINILLMPGVTQAFHLLIATGCVMENGHASCSSMISWIISNPPPPAR